MNQIEQMLREAARTCLQMVKSTSVEVLRTTKVIEKPEFDGHWSVKQPLQKARAIRNHVFLLSTQHGGILQTVIIPFTIIEFLKGFASVVLKCAARRKNTNGGLFVMVSVMPFLA